MSDAPDANDRSLLPIAEVLALLREGTLESVQELPWSSNYTFLARVQRGEQEALAVYKPRRGERPLWDFPAGTLYRREVAAWLLSDALGWHLVPPTVVRQGEHGVGMVQLWVEHDPEQHFFTFREPWPEQLTRIALFDVVANNADRKGGHCLRDESGRIWAIDHGICFHEEPKLRTVIWEVAGQPIPPPLLADLESLFQRLRANEPPAAELQRLLTAREFAALLARIAALLDTRTFPLPPADRRYVPWPMV